MAQDQQLVDVQAKSGGWTQLTNADVTGNLTFQVRLGAVDLIYSANPPKGVIAAAPGSQVYTPVGTYKKVSGSGPTGWAAL